MINEYSVAGSGIGHENMGHSADELAVLQNRASTHE